MSDDDALIADLSEQVANAKTVERTLFDRIALADARIAELTEALERVEKDINWMLNNRKFLNANVFDYIDDALAKGKP